MTTVASRSVYCLAICCLVFISRVAGFAFVEDTNSSLPIGLAHAISIAVGDHIYIFGGSTSPSSLTGAVYVYDATSNLVTSRNTAPAGIKGACVAQIGEDTLKFFGGIDAPGLPPQSTYRYNIQSDTWTSEPVMNPSLTSPLCVTDQTTGNVVLFTKSSTNNMKVTYIVKEDRYESVAMPLTTQALSQVVQYNGAFFGIGSQQIIVVPMGAPFGYLQSPVFNFGSFVHENDLWVIGGTSFPPPQNGWLFGATSVQSFNFTNLAVTEHDFLPFGMNGPIVHKLGGSIHIFGGVLNGAASVKHFVAKCVLSCPANTMCSNVTGLCEASTSPPIEVPSASIPVTVPTDAPQSPPVHSPPYAVAPSNEPTVSEPITTEQPIGDVPPSISEPPPFEPVSVSEPVPLASSPTTEVDLGNVSAATPLIQYENSMFMLVIIVTFL